MDSFFKCCIALVTLAALPAAVQAKPSHLNKVRAALTSGKHPVKIVCLGDSVTGIYYHTGGRRAWPEMLEVALRRLYKKAKPVVVNAGVSGDTTIQALARFDADVAQQQPDVVVVMLGLNDLIKSSADQFAQNLNQIVDRSQALGAAVVLCTQNNIDESVPTGGRTNENLAVYAEIIRQIARERQLPVADCFAAFEQQRARDPVAWRMLLSDPFHPTMNGHKRFAEVVAAAISGKTVSLDDVGPPTPAIPKTLELLAGGRPVKVLAMSPYDTLIGPALKKLNPAAKVEVTSWQTDGTSFDALLQTAATVRNLKVDLVVVAIPDLLSSVDDVSYCRGYVKLLNESLSFGVQEWDVIAFLPSLARPDLPQLAKAREQLARYMVAGQDLGTLVRKAGNQTPVAELLDRWLAEQVRSASAGSP